MKKLKKLTRDQKKFLEKERLNPNDFLIERATPEEYVFYNKYTEALWTYDRTMGVWLWVKKHLNYYYLTVMLLCGAKEGGLYGEYLYT